MPQNYHEWTLVEANARLKLHQEGTPEYEEVRQIRELIYVRDRARMLERIQYLENQNRELARESCRCSCKPCRYCNYTDKDG